MEIAYLRCRLRLLALIILSCPVILYAQTSEGQLDSTAALTVDSLSHIINTGHDTDIINAKLEIALVFSESNPDTTFLLYDEVPSAIEERTDQDTGQVASFYHLAKGRVLELIAWEHYGHNLFNKALTNFYKALKIYKTLGEKELMADSYLGIGLIHEWQRNVEESIRCYNRALLAYISIDDEPGEATCYNNLAWVYLGQGKVELALKFHYQALEMGYKMTGEEKVGQLSSSFNSIGTIYMDLAENKKLPDDSIATLLDTALICFQQGFQYLNQLGEMSHYNRIDTYLDFANVFFARGKRDSSIHYINKATEISRNKENRRSIESIKYRLFKQDGDFKRALEAYEQYILNRDSLFNDKTQKNAIRQQTRYEFEKNQLIEEQEARELLRLDQEKTQRRDNLQYSVVLICLLVLGVGLSMLGTITISTRIAEGLIFFSFLIFFEFILVLADPYIEDWSGGAPGIKLLFNAAIAALIFPLHAFFEDSIKKRIKLQ